MRIAGVILAFVMSVTGASAATMQAVYTGYLADGYDTTGIFGLGAGANLAGQGFVVNTVYDTGLGNRFSYSPGQDDYLVGGQLWAAVVPYLSFTVTINGITNSILTSFNSQMSAYDFGQSSPPSGFFQGAGGTQFDASTGFPVLSSSANVNLMSASGKIPASLDAAFTWKFNPRDTYSNGYGAFAITDPTGMSGIYTTGTFVIRNATVVDTQVAPVPLPASALMLMAGLGGLAAARKRRVRLSRTISVFTKRLRRGRSFVNDLLAGSAPAFAGMTAGLG
jgi:hypothetical protein